MRRAAPSAVTHACVGSNNLFEELPHDLLELSVVLRPKHEFLLGFASEIPIRRPTSL